MNPPQHCARCGTRLTGGPAGRSCAKCLGLLVLDPGRMGLAGETQTPAPPRLEPVSDPLATGPETAEGLPFGDYLLRKEIARGGMGVVYEAHQLSLDRRVAVKMILPGHLRDRQAIERFLKEAQAAAQIRHPHIVAIHEVGEHQGRHFYSMDFVDGPSLAQRARHYPLSARQATHYVKTVAEATHFAHEHGVLHRDLKPSNILIDSQDRPLIADFGLAKFLHEGSDLTLSGVAVGSPSYIAPEQARGQSAQVGVRSDVYSLGAILYELITGRPPFQGESASATLRMVVENDPVPPRRMNPKVPRDLETVCLKCLEKDPHRRYSTAGELAQDLDRFEQGRPIRARPVGIAGRTWRWCRRQPALAGTLAASGLLLLLGFGAVTWQWRLAEGARLRQRLRAYASDMRAADLAHAAGDLGQSMDLLERYLPQPGEEDLRGLEWRYLWALNRSEDAGGYAYPTIPFSGDLTPDGRWIATSGLDGWLRIHDVQGKLVVREPTGYSKVTMPETAVACSPLGDWIAAATTNQILVYDTRHFQIQRRLACRSAVVAFSPNGLRLAGLDERGLQIWSTRTWRSELAPGECVVPRNADQQLVFGPDNCLIALANLWTPGIALWSLATRSFVATNLPMENVVSVAISPNGRWLAAGSAQGRVNVWELATLTEPWALPDSTQWVLGLAFSPDSQWLATGGVSPQIHLWQAGTTNLIRRLNGHRGEVWWLRFSPDGQWLYSGSEDQTVRRWRREAAAAVTDRFELPTTNSLLCDLTAQGARATVFDLPTFVFGTWDWKRARPLERVALQGDPAESWATGNSRLAGPHLLAGSLQRKGDWIFDVRTGARLFPPPASTRRFRPVCVSADGRWVSGVEETDGRWVGGVWEVNTGRLRLPLPDQARDASGAGNAAFSPDGQRLAFETLDHGICVYTLATARTLRLPGHGRALYTVQFSPDGRWLASSGWDSTLRVWDTATGQPVTRWIRCIATSLQFSRDGETLIAGDNVQDCFRFWHVRTGAELLQKRPKSPCLHPAVDSEDTTLLTTADPRGTTVVLTRLPALPDIDRELQTRTLRRVDPVEP